MIFWGRRSYVKCFCQFLFLSHIRYLANLRIYQGTPHKGNQITNVNDGFWVKLFCIVQLHSDEMEEIYKAEAGNVVAIFGVECRSMDTFSDNLAMDTMFVLNH